MVRRRFNGLVAAMRRHRRLAGALAPAIDRFAKVARSYRPGLFHCCAVPGLPRTNNGLEQLFGSQRHHERRATGREAASPAAVLRGEMRLIAATATRICPPSGRELGRANRQAWSELPQRLDQRRHARTLRTRFRRNPDAYLAERDRAAAYGSTTTWPFMCKREPTPNFRCGPELTRFVALVGGVCADVGERGLIRGA